MLYLAILGCFLLSFTLTFLVRKIALKRSIMDVPNDRSSHDIPTPRGGGLAIALVWFLSVVVFHHTGDISDELFFALLSGLILVVISFIDDILSISYSVRIIFQILSITIGLFFIGGVEHLDFGIFQINHTILLSIVAGLALLWFLNLYNFIDGIDGYAASEAIFLSLVIFLFSGNLLILFLGASAAGFLYWNFGKKKIFMGDVGSTLLGYTLGILALHENNQGEMPVLLFVMLSSIFWFDATVTLIRRFIDKEQITKPHKKHAYQRIVQAGFSHGKTVIYGMVINFLLLVLAYFAWNYFNLIILALCLNLVFLGFVMRKIDKIRPFNTHDLSVNKEK